MFSFPTRQESLIDSEGGNHEPVRKSLGDI